MTGHGILRPVGDGGRGGASRGSIRYAWNASQSPFRYVAPHVQHRLRPRPRPVHPRTLHPVLHADAGTPLRSPRWLSGSPSPGTRRTASAPRSPPGSCNILAQVRLLLPRQATLRPHPPQPHHHPLRLAPSACATPAPARRTPPPRCPPRGTGAPPATAAASRAAGPGFRRVPPRQVRRRASHNASWPSFKYTISFSRLVPLGVLVGPPSRPSPGPMPRVSRGKVAHAARAGFGRGCGSACRGTGRRRLLPPSARMSDPPCTRCLTVAIRLRLALSPLRAMSRRRRMSAGAASRSPCRGAGHHDFSFVRRLRPVRGSATAWPSAGSCVPAHPPIA